MTVQFEPVIGRYLRMELFGRPHRTYVEEAGQGVPLLCLHTAGSDGRQYRALMNDPEIISNHRVIAFDMLWHGKSSPPVGWHNEEYQLTSLDYTMMILEVARALELDRPIVKGCSIGGRIVLHLALEYSYTPEETLEVARSIPGSEVTIMEGLGHFPMSEDPQKFIQYLSPVLQKIRNNKTA